MKLVEIWDSFIPDYCGYLLESIPAKIQAIIEAKGDVTSL